MKDSRPHTSSKYICPENKQRPNLSANSSCVREMAKVWFNHVYTGCYSLVFIADKSYYEFRKNAFLETTYKKTEVGTPLVSCNVQSTVHETHKGFEPVQCWAYNGIGPVDELLQVDIIEDQRCDDKSLATCRPALNPRPEQIIFVQNYLKNEIEIRFPLSEEECHYDIRILFKTAMKSECDLLTWKRDHKISKKSKLCSMEERQTSIRVNDPITGCYGVSFTTFNKTWILKTTYLYVENIKIKNIILAVIALSIIIGILVAAMRYSKKSCHTDNKAPASPAEIAVPEMKMIRPQLTHEKDVMLMYVQHDEDFMEAMINLQMQLAGRIGASVYSWWTPSVFQNVPAEGVYEWATTRISQGCQVIWFDTKTTREFLASVVECTSVDTDHRDKNLKKIYEHVVYIKDLETENRNHHIVRFTKPEYAVPDIMDPFSEIVKNTRFKLPEQMEQLVNILQFN